MPAPRPTVPIRVYMTPLSGHCHRVVLFLSLLDLPFETMPVNLKTGENRRPEFLAISPFGQVPAIRDGAYTLCDSNAILVYLAQRYGDASWLPGDPAGAAAVQRWLSLAAGPIAYGPCAARLITLFNAPLDHTHAVQITTRLFDVIEPEFAAHPYAIGDHPTIADLAAYAYIAHAPEGGISLAPYPNLRAWIKRIEALSRFVPMQASTPLPRKNEQA